jgi:hypothetical protein
VGLLVLSVYWTGVYDGKAAVVLVVDGATGKVLSAGDGVRIGSAPG